MGRSSNIICASNSVGRVAAFGEVIQLEENANASSNLAFSTISRLSGVRVTSGAPFNNKRKLESFLKIIYNIYKVEKGVRNEFQY